MIGEVLKVARVAHDMSIKELAEKSSVSASYITELENKNKKNPSLNKLEKIVANFDLSLSELFEIDEYHDSIIGTKEELRVYQLLLLRTLKVCIENDERKARSK